MRKKVLIVEDEIFVALEIEQIVEDAGFGVGAIAADRAAALAHARDCDIALVDLNLRDGPTGPQIGMELASQHGVRVIYVTANPAQIGEAAVAALGVITKPIIAPIRRFIPPLGTIDITPMVAIIILVIIVKVLNAL